jgi:diaminopimelate decarboxylase
MLSHIGSQVAGAQDFAVLLTCIENARLRGSLPWLYLDAGYNLLLDSAAVRWYYHMVNAGRMDGPCDRAHRVVGPPCDSADCFFDVEGEAPWKALSPRLSALSPQVREELRATIVRLPETRSFPCGYRARGPHCLARYRCLRAGRDVSVLRPAARQSRHGGS